MPRRRCSSSSRRDTYVTDRLFDRAVLLTGVDGREQQVLIERVGIEDEIAPPLNPFGVH